MKADRSSVSCRSVRELPLTPEEHLLVGQEPGEPHGVNRDAADGFAARRGRIRASVPPTRVRRGGDLPGRVERGSGRRVALLVVVELDDLHVGEPARRLAREPLQQDHPHREVGRQEEAPSPGRGALAELGHGGAIEPGGAGDDVAARVERGADHVDGRRGDREVDHHVDPAVAERRDQVVPASAGAGEREVLGGTHRGDAGLPHAPRGAAHVHTDHELARQQSTLAALRLSASSSRRSDQAGLAATRNDPQDRQQRLSRACSGCLRRDA